MDLIDKLKAVLARVDGMAGDYEDTPAIITIGELRAIVARCEKTEYRLSAIEAAARNAIQHCRTSLFQVAIDDLESVLKGGHHELSGMGS